MLVFFYLVVIPGKQQFKESIDILDLMSIRTQADQKCIHPSLSLWTPELLEVFANKPAPLDCSVRPQKNWVYTLDGKFRISAEAVDKYGPIECEYIPILRGPDDFNIKSGPPVTVKDGENLLTDFFEVNCRSSKGYSYYNKHSGVALNKTAVNRSERMKRHSGNGSLPSLDIFIFGFDSVSRMSWMRSLPKTHSYFVDRLGGVVLEGYNIVGDGTTQALLPMLTGRTETELPESRRGFDGATTVDGFPWFWNDLHKIGYVTQYGEDQSPYGTFTYRLLGFKDQPTDHYMRPFHLAVEGDRRASYCLRGSTPEHIEMMNWMREFINVYRTQPKFSFVFECELTHDSDRFLSLADDDFLNLLRHLNDSGHLDNALLITMSDHGARFSGLRETNQGRLEERNPYIGIRLPPRFIAQHPEALANLRRNVHRLSTPFDLHATLREVVSFTGTELGDGLSGRGISLFKEIPKQRTCQDAGIELHWCACLSWTPLPLNDSLVLRAAHEIVNKFNNLTQEEVDKCEILSLKAVKSAVRYSANENVLKFRKSLDLHGREPDLSDARQAAVLLYLVTLVTTPGDGVFEATATYRVHDDVFVVDSKSLSRINKYGSQPHCIMDELPHLRQFCYCKVQL